MKLSEPVSQWTEFLFIFIYFLAGSLSGVQWTEFNSLLRDQCVQKTRLNVIEDTRVKTIECLLLRALYD